MTAMPDQRPRPSRIDRLNQKRWSLLMRLRMWLRGRGAGSGRGRR